MPTILEIIKADSAYLKDAIVTMDTLCETVEIEDGSGKQEPIFLQGQDAHEFIVSFKKLTQESPDSLFWDIERHLAKKYVDSLWS